MTFFIFIAQYLGQIMISNKNEEICNAYSVIGAANPHAQNIIRQPTSLLLLAAQVCVRV